MTAANIDANANDTNWMETDTDTDKDTNPDIESDTVMDTEWKRTRTRTQTWTRKLLLKNRQSRHAENGRAHRVIG